MSRYQAPKHTTGVFTSASGERRADKAGVITLPADAPASDHAQMLSAGCVELPGSTAKAAAPARARGKRKAKAKTAAAPKAPDSVEPPSA